MKLYKKSLCALLATLLVAGPAMTAVHAEEVGTNTTTEVTQTVEDVAQEEVAPAEGQSPIIKDMTVRTNATDADKETFGGIFDFIPFVLPTGGVDVKAFVHTTTRDMLMVNVENGIASADFTFNTEDVKADVLGLQLEGKMSEFEDVKMDDWFFEYVQSATSNGFLNGVSETSYAPNALLTLRDTVTALNRVLTYNNDMSMATSRTYVEGQLEGMEKDAHYFNTANLLSKMSIEEIAQMKDMLTQDITRTITRGELAQVLYYALHDVINVPGTPVEFTDVYDATEAIDFCARVGLMTGKTENTFDPTASLKRAEFATVLDRVNNLYTINAMMNNK